MVYLGGICFITDQRKKSESASNITSMVLQSGITCVQYREKEKTRRAIYEEALELRTLTNRYNSTLIINDYADIARAVDADGVHLGQDDLPLEKARSIMKDRIVGISTHNLAQAKEAEAGGADYIGFGPVFHTTTKDAGKPVGVQNLKAVAVATAILEGDINENVKKFMNILKGINK
jgi:thiamine-phosphate pyrophosphorylase